MVGGHFLSPCANADFTAWTPVAVVYARLVFNSGSGSAKKRRHCRAKILKKIRQRAHVPEMHCASSDATLHPGMHGLTQDEGIISAHLCV